MKVNEMSKKAAQGVMEFIITTDFRNYQDHEILQT